MKRDKRDHRRQRWRMALLLAGSALLPLVQTGAQPALPEFEAPTRFTNSDTQTELARNPHGNMAYGQDGALHLVYTELNTEGTGSGLPGTMLYRVYRDGEWNTPLPIRSQAGDRVPLNSGGNPSLVVSGDNTVHFAWHDYRNSTSNLGTNNIDVYYRKLLPSGTFAGEEQQVTSLEGNSWRPKIRASRDGLLMIGWYDFFRAGLQDMLVTFADSEGVFHGGETFDDRLVMPLEGAPDSDPALLGGVVIPDFAFTPDGALHSVWTTGFTDAEAVLNYGVIEDPVSRRMSQLQRISGTGGAFGDPPKIRADESGNVWAVWADRVDGVNHNIYLAVKRPNAAAFDPPAAVTDFDFPNAAERASIAIAPSGIAYIVWTDHRDSEGDLFLRAYDPAQGQLSAELRLTEEILTVDTRPLIEIGGQGEITIVWQSDRDGNTELYMMQSKQETAIRSWSSYEQ